MRRVPHVLVLGGTGEGRALADLLARRRWRVTYALAGLTPSPILPAGVRVRRGGFGGVDGLRAFITDEDVTIVADVTHPFARRVQTNAASACARAGIVRVRLERSSWRPTPADHWFPLDDIAEVTGALPWQARALAAIGSRGLRVLAARADVWLHARVMAPPRFALPPRWRLLRSGPRKTVAAELALLRAVRARWLIVREAGGTAGWPRLLAARHLGLPVLMVRRPPSPPADETVDNVHSMLEVIDTIISNS